VGISGVEVGWRYVDPDESGKGVDRLLLKTRSRRLCAEWQQARIKFVFTRGIFNR
jgi:hypothetical protein